MFDCISDRPINIPGFMVGFIVAFGMPSAFVVTFGMTGFPTVALGMAPVSPSASPLGIPFDIPVVAFGIVAIFVGEAIFVAIGLIVGVTVAAVETATVAATNDIRTSSTNATFNILIPIPPQYPLCRTTHQ